MSSKCLLRSLDFHYGDVTVWDSEPVRIGRSRDTRIKDKRCSKQQVEVSCSLDKYTCQVLQLGSNSSTVQGQQLQQGSVVQAQHGHVVELLSGAYKYCIEFNPPPTTGRTSDISAGNDEAVAPEPRSRKVNTGNSGTKETQPMTPAVENEEREDTAKKSTKDTKSDKRLINKVTKGNANLDKKLKSKDTKDTITDKKSKSKDAKDNSTKPNKFVSKIPLNKTTEENNYLIKDKELKGPSGGKKRPAGDQPAMGSGGPATKRAKMAVSDGQTAIWTSVANGDLLVYNKDGLPGSTKVASYDMDGTLILTQSGKVFAQNYSDWKIIFTEVPGKLKSLYADGYKIVIFTNQAGIGKGKHTAAGMKSKISDIIKRLGVPMQALVSTGRGKYRKPCTGMWEYFQEHCNCGLTVDKSNSVYVGDAAGRPEVAKQRKKDHSLADRLYALNVCLPFKTPEEHFMSRRTEVFKMPEFDPRQLSGAGALLDPPTAKLKSPSTEMIVLVGFPGSGKSVLASRELVTLGYQHISRDSIGTWQKCVTAAQKALKSGQSVVVDNTNPDRESRSRYIKMATELNVPVRCFLLDVGKEHSKHNNKFRELTDPNHSKVSDMIYNMYNSKYQAPEKNEGFSDVVKVKFIPKFEDEAEEQLYRQFLLEK